jgi:hypothetical protein
MSTDWDADARGMTPDEWADVFEAGAGAFPGEQNSSREDLKAVLLAMAAGCRRVDRLRDSRHD